MNTSMPQAVAAKPQTGFNFNKLQAVICIALSAATSISVLVWAAKFF